MAYDLVGWLADQVESGKLGGTSAVVALGNITGTITCNLSQGVCFTGTLTGDVTINFSNWPAAPALTEPLLILTQDATGGHAITISGAVWEPAGSAPTFDTAAGHVNIIPLSSPDQGTHLYGSGDSGSSPSTGQVNIELIATPFSNAHFNTVAQSSLDYGGAELQSDGTQGAFATFQAYMQAGTYTIDVYTKSGATHGIAQFDVDGTVIATLDTYAASGAQVRQVYTNYVIPASGVHNVTITMTDKNASATSYIGVFEKLIFTRTGS